MTKPKLTLRAVYEAIEEAGTITTHNLAKRLNVVPGLLSAHLKRLRDQDHILCKKTSTGAAVTAAKKWCLGPRKLRPHLRPVADESGGWSSAGLKLITGRWGKEIPKRVYW